jgi:hypothetical protein
MAEDEDYLRGLSVIEFVPRDGDLAAAVRARHPDGADALLDLVSHEPGAFDAALRTVPGLPPRMAPPATAPATPT